MRRDVLNSPRLRELKKKKTRGTRNKSFVVFLCIIAMYGLLGAVSRAERINIQNINISGNQTVGTSLIENTIRKEISGNYLLVFPKTNFLFYPKNKIIKALQKDFSRLENIHVSLNDIHTLYITVTERSGEYIWCGEDLPKEGVGPLDVQCFFVDSKGFIFDEAPYFSGDVYFRFFGSVSGDVLGAEYFPDIFAKLISFKDNIANMGLAPTHLFVKPDGDIEVYLSSSGMVPPKILLNVDLDFEKATENLQTALATDPLESELKQKYSLLEYIDLRFGNKVYYRFK